MEPFDPKYFDIEISLNLDGVDHARSLSRDIKIDNSDIQYEFIHHAEMFAWWATMTELCKDLLLQRKTDLTRLGAVIDSKVRNQAKIRELETRQQNIKLKAEKQALLPEIKYTEKMVENEVVTHPDYKELEEEVANLKKKLGLLTAGKEAMVHRRDMLLALGRILQQEGTSNPTILKDAYQGRRHRYKEEVQYQKEQEEYRPKKRPVGKKKR